MRNSKQTNTDRVLNEFYVIASTDSRGYSVFLRVEFEDIIDKYDLNCYVYKPNNANSKDKERLLLFDYDINYSRTLLLFDKAQAEKLLARIKKIYDKKQDRVADFTEIGKKKRYKEYIASYDNLHIEKISISVKRIE